FRTRRVALRGHWWSGECGSMVGAWRKAEGKTPVPVAIRRVPTNGIRGSRYVIWNPVDDVEVPVDSESAANLSPFAYVFYRPMPREPSRLGRLLRLGLDGSQWDGITILALGIIAGGLAAFTPVLTGKVYDVAIPE